MKKKHYLCTALRKIGRVIECARLEIWYTHYVVSGV